jgi:hypothetical protein
MTMYFKPVGRTECRLFFSDTPFTNWFYADFNCSTLAVEFHDRAGTGQFYTASISAAPNGFFKLTVTGTLGGGITTSYAYFQLLSGFNTPSYPGSGALAGYVWGSSFNTGTNVGQNVDPKLVSPGAMPTTNGYNPNLLEAYRLQASSPVTSTGIDLAAQFYTNQGPQDYYGNVIPNEQNQFAMGAWQGLVAALALGTSPIVGGTPTDVLYVGAGPVLAQAANFNILGGQPNVVLGAMAYLYDGQAALYKVPNIVADNWFIGVAGNFTMTGGGNMGMGYGALHNITSGADNVSIGAFSGGAMTTDVHNVFIGTSAGQIQNGGTNNIFIGFASGAASTISNYNTCIGDSGVPALAGGNANTCIGFNNASTIISASNCIVIGMQCDVPSASANGQMSLGNFLYGTGLTGTGSTISTGWLGVGVKSAFGSEAFGVAGPITAQGSSSGNFTIESKNTNTTGTAVFQCNNTGSSASQLGITGTAYGGYGPFIANTGFIYDSTARFVIMQDNNGPVIIATGSGPAVDRFHIDSTGKVLAATATGGMGYGPAAGGTGGVVTQATNKATGVTLNNVCGQITMNAAALAASTTVSFTLTNSAIAATDLLVLNHVSGGTAGAYTLNSQCAGGSASINVRNVSLGSLSEAIVIGFALQKAVIN